MTLHRRPHAALVEPLAPLTWGRAARGVLRGHRPRPRPRRPPRRRPGVRRTLDLRAWDGPASARARPTPALHGRTLGGYVAAQQTSRLTGATMTGHRQLGDDGFAHGPCPRGDSLAIRRDRVPSTDTRPRRRCRLGNHDPPVGRHAGGATARRDDPVRGRSGLATHRVPGASDEPVAPGPLPWLPDTPAEVADDPRWGPYLSARARLVRTLATEVRDRADATLPSWLDNYDDVLTPDLRAQIAIWRAAQAITPANAPSPAQRPTTTAPPPTAAASSAPSTPGTTTPSMRVNAEWSPTSAGPTSTP